MTEPPDEQPHEQPHEQPDEQPPPTQPPGGVQPPSGPPVYWPPGQGPAGPAPYQAWSPPPQQASAGLVVGAVFAGLGASFFAPFLGVLLTTQFNSPAGLIVLPLLVLGLGIFLTARGSTRGFGLPFLISFILGFIVLAGLCISLISAMSGVG